MKPLATSLPQPTGSSSACDSSTNQRRAKYAAERARVLFGCYRRGDANDPDTYVAAVAAVLAEYPEDTIKHVTDPRTGLPSNPVANPDTGRVWSGLPDISDVRRACERHYGPTRRAQEREAAERRQLAERQQLRITDGRPRKTYEELVADCQARGLNIGPKRSSVQAIDAFLAEHNVTREQFDALPDLPKDIGISRRT